jgi:phthiocerol/phenolphthiocerol synthesis type-I polyketide synthase E
MKSPAPALARMTFGTLDLSVIDPHVRDTQYIYDEIFGAEIYRHTKMKMRDKSVMMDVGANIGLFAIWAHQQFKPRDIYSFEASPQTYAYLADNVARLIDAKVTKVHTVNKAVASAAGRTLTLHQSPLVSGISTLLDKAKVPWVRQLSDSKELVEHKVTTTTVSAEIAANKIERIDLLKIDVEGFFMEVLNGISDADLAKVQNLVIEIDYAKEAGSSPDAVADMLTAKGYTTEWREDLTLYAWRG